MDFSTGNEPRREPDPGNSSGEMGDPGSEMSGGSGNGGFDLGDPVQSFIRTVQGVLLNPVGFFRELPRQGGFVPPLVFALICSVIAGVLAGIVNALVGLTFSNQGIGTVLGALVFTIILTPIFTAIGLFVGAAIFHLLVFLLVKPSNAGFEATFRVGAYISATQLFSWLSGVPILGILISLAVGVYSIVLAVLGIREMHSTTTGRAVAVVLIPVVVVGIIGLLIAVVIGILIAAAFSQ